MIFRPRQIKCHFNINLTINGKQIKEKVFLGVILDEHLSWKPQIFHKLLIKYLNLLESYLNLVFTSLSHVCVPCNFLLFSHIYIIVV